MDKEIDYFLHEKNPTFKDVEKLVEKIRESLLTRGGYKPKEQDCTAMEIKLFAVLNAEKFLVPTFKREEN
jgi:hypothetical protein